MKVIFTCTLEIPITNIEVVPALEKIIMRDAVKGLQLSNKEVFTIVETTILEDE